MSNFFSCLSLFLSTNLHVLLNRICICFIFLNNCPFLDSFSSHRALGNSYLGCLPVVFSLLIFVSSFMLTYLKDIKSAMVMTNYNINTLLKSGILNYFFYLYLQLMMISYYGLSSSNSIPPQ